MSEELTGTIVPLVTPFDKEEKFDAGGMTGLIDYIIDQCADASWPQRLQGKGRFFHRMNCPATYGSHA